MLDTALEFPVYTVQAYKVRLDIEACSVKQPPCILACVATKLGRMTRSNQEVL